MIHSSKDRAWMLFVLLLALIVRLSLLFASDFVIDADEAVVGLMAKHILEGRKIPVFYYGQDYMGSLEAILAAASFSLFGMSSVSLKLVPLVFSLFHVFLVYELASRLSRGFAARLAAFFAALAPSALVLWSGMARGGFIELVCFGTLSLILSLDILEQQRPRQKQFFLLGALLGFSWWVNNQIVFYLIAIFIVFLPVFFLKLGSKQTLRSFFSTCLGFFLGSLPFWFYNLKPPYFRTIRFLMSEQAPAASSFGGNFLGLFAKALPIIFGSRRFWSQEDIFYFATPIVYLLYFFFLLSFFRQASRSQQKLGYALLLIFCLSVFFVFSASGFGWLSLAPRYLLPLYSVIFVFIGIGLSELWQCSVVASAATCLFLLLVHLASNFYPKLVTPGEPFIYRGQRLAHQHSELYAWLLENNYSKINANYWLGYRAAFETEERLKFTRFGSPRALRIPEYELDDAWQQEFEVYVSVPSEIELLARTLSSQGYAFRKSRLASYQVLDHIRPLHENLKELELRAEHIKVSDRPDLVKNLLDDDLSTRWASSRPQSEEMYLELNFAGGQEVAALFIDTGKFNHDGARELTVEGQDEQGNWCLLFDSYGTKMFYDAREGNFSALPPSLKIYFEPKKLQAIRLAQRGRDPIFDWSIADLSIYQIRN